MSIDIQPPPSGESENRVHRVTIRFTETEFTSLKKQVANSQSRETADYIRRVLLHRKVRMVYRDRSLDEWLTELTRLRKELNAIGNNFNQVTKKINSTGGTKEFPFWLAEATRNQEKLLGFTQRIQARIDQFAEVWFARSSKEQDSKDS